MKKGCCRKISDLFIFFVFFDGQPFVIWDRFCLILSCLQGGKKTMFFLHFPVRNVKEKNHDVVTVGSRSLTLGHDLISNLRSILNLKVHM